MDNCTARLIVVVALPCEARPLIDYYQLKKDLDSTVFAIYHHKKMPFSLLITGVGKIKMAAAIAYTHQYLLLGSESYYINLGIAGSAALALGKLIVADKIIDHATGCAYFPLIGAEKSALLAPVVTYDAPVVDYPATGVVDMEASAFFATSTLFVAQEQVMTLKIVSDSNVQQQTGLNQKQVATLISAQLTVIDKRIQAVLSMILALDCAADEQCREDFRCLTQRWHFTVHQQKRLQQLLRRWRVLLPQQHPLPICIVDSSAKQVLLTMESYLRQCKLFT